MLDLPPKIATPKGGFPMSDPIHPSSVFVPCICTILDTPGCLWQCTPGHLHDLYSMAVSWEPTGTEPMGIQTANGGFCLANEPEIRSGWWYTYPSEKYEFVSWDDEIPTIWKNKFYVPNHQPEIIKVSFTFSVTKCCYTKEIHAKVATASRQCRTASQFHAMIKLRSTGYVPTRNSPMSRLTPSWPVPSSFMGTSATFRWCHFLGHSEQWIRPSRFRAANWPQPNALWFLWGLGHPCLYSFNTVHIKGWAKATKIVSPVCHPQLRRCWGIEPKAD